MTQAREFAAQPVVEAVPAQRDAARFSIRVRGGGLRNRISDNRPDAPAPAFEKWSSMKPEKAGVRKRVAKRPRRTARVAKPSRAAPRVVPAAKPGRPKLLASGDLTHSLGYRIRRAQLWVFKDVSRRLAAFEISP